MRIRWRNFELPSRVQPDEQTLTTEYGRFSIEPFERGFGHTIGNGLRRVLISSIEGAAVTAVRIEGASHEFDSLEGVYEDVAEIVLNIKRLRVQYDGDEPLICRIQKSGEGLVTGADVECPGDARVRGSEIETTTHISGYRLDWRTAPCSYRGPSAEFLEKAAKGEAPERYILACDRNGAEGRSPHHAGGVAVLWNNSEVQFVRWEEMEGYEGGPVPVTAQEGRYAVELCWAALQSAREGRPVTLPLDPKNYPSYLTEG